MNNVYRYLFEQVNDAATALIQHERQVSYGELRGLIESVAYTLTTLGVTLGDRVAILAENSPFWVACYLGSLKIGAVAAPIPARLNSAALSETLTTLGCKVLCVSASQYPKIIGPIDAFASDVPILIDQRGTLTDERLIMPLVNGTCPTVASDDPHQLAALMFTSGSTGTPNAVKVSHRNIIANTDSIVSYLDLSPTDRILDILPFEYCFGTSLLHSHLRAGGSLVIQNSFLFLEDVLKHLERTACNAFAGVPATFQNLLRRSSLGRRPYPTLRKVQQAGGRLAPALIDEFQQAQPQADLFIMYGQTEATARLSYLPPAALHSKRGSIGRGLPGVTLQVLTDTGDVAPVGTVGEVVAEGANVTLGYWAPDPNKNPFHDGKLYTGDLGYCDEDGYIFLVDRVSDFIKPMGHRISSREIEDVLAAQSSVVECAVIGVPDEVAGETAVAYIVALPNQPISAEALIAFCKLKLPSYAVPQRVILTAELPKSSAGKVLKKELKTQYLQTLQADATG